MIVEFVQDCCWFLGCVGWVRGCAVAVLCEVVKLVGRLVVGDLGVGEAADGVAAAFAARVEVFVGVEFFDGDQFVVRVDAAVGSAVGAAGGVCAALVEASGVGGVGLYGGEDA
ncbi:hypothetical protein ACFYWU_37475 [Streptomyces chrestomyceticus]|uniref:hypothetical protein n=1 Tax=Streptomyces chrestomyceticus TaxID=68185 RepID=UPI0036CE1732